ncbi:hypothetical protein BC834DRAFT_966569 [Gloeopeniophorella convolvens]|nr:hypothetical protein BC834DRAFT_966569 [Gloeopeniophorella convolvens]
MKSYVRASQDPYEANCPTCRTSFPIVVPDLSMIPKKYHVFIAPSIRRVYLQDGQVLALQRRVTSLTRDKHLLMDRAEAAQSALDRLSFENANQKYQLLLDKHHALQARVPAAVVPAPAKRTGEQAALDASTRSDSPSSDSSSSPAEFLFRGKRIYRPMPKRPRLQPMVAQTPRPSTLATSSRVAVSSPSSSSSSSSSPATSRITSNSVIEQEAYLPFTGAACRDMISSNVTV